MIGTIYLKDHVHLLLEPNATILGSDRLADYGNDVGLNPFYPETIDPCLIYAKNAMDIGIRGEGKIVGHTNNAFTPPPGGDARAVNSREISLRNVRIENDKQDGFDLGSCQNVSISDCHLDCGDDAIAVTTSVKDRPSRNITITNCLQKSRCAGIRFGPLSKGDFENISVSNCIFYDCIRRH